MAIKNIIESFFVYLGFEIGEEELREWEEKLHDVENITAAVGAVCLAASASVAIFVNEMAEHLGELDEFAERNELNIEKLQEYGYAASVTGSSLEAVKSSMQGLNQIIGEAALGVGRGAMIFKKLHLEAKGANGEVKNATEMFGELATRMRGLSVQEALGMSRRLRIDPSLITLMRGGSEELERLTGEAKEFGVVNQEQADQAKELMNSWKKLQYVLMATGEFIAVRLFPTFLRVAEALRKWVLENRAVISGGLVKFINVVNAVLGTMWDWVSRIVKVLALVVSWITQWRVVSYSLLAVLGAIITSGFIEMLGSAWGAVMKLRDAIAELDLVSAGWGLLIGGLVLAIGLLVDDLWNYYHGNDSLIGQLQTRFPHALAIAQTALAVLSGIMIALKWDAIATAASMVVSMATMAGSFLMAIPEAAALSLAMIGIDIPASIILAVILAIVAAVALLGLAGYELYKHWDGVMAWFHKTWDSLSAKVKAFVDLVEGAASKVADLLGAKGPGGVSWGALAGAAVLGPAGVPLGLLGASGALGRGSSNSTSSVSYRREVHAPITVISLDPDRAGQAVHDKMQEMHGSTIRDGQTGVGW